MSEPVKVFGFAEQELMEEDPVVLRTLIHERVHHTIEVLIYRIMAGKMRVPANFGETVELLLDIWIARANKCGRPIFWLATKCPSCGEPVKPF